MGVDQENPKPKTSGNDLFATSLHEFVVAFVKPSFEAPRHGVFWCKKWADHPQGVLILEGLWRSYEQARAVDMASHGGLSTIDYLSERFYPMMERLTGTSGPFARCTPSECGGIVKLGEDFDAQVD